MLVPHPDSPNTKLFCWLAAPKWQDIMPPQEAVRSCANDSRARRHLSGSMHIPDMLTVAKGTGPPPPPPPPCSAFCKEGPRGGGLLAPQVVQQQL